MTPDELRERCEKALDSIITFDLPTNEEAGKRLYDGQAKELESLCREMIAAGLERATSGLKVSNEKLVWALKELGPTGTNAEACVKAAVEQIIWCRQEAQRVKEDVWITEKAAQEDGCRVDAGRIEECQRELGS